MKSFKEYLIEYDGLKSENDGCDDSKDLESIINNINDSIDERK